MAGEVFVTASPGTSCSEVTLATCAAAGFSPDVRHYSVDWRAIASLVSVEAGIALVPRLAAPLDGPGVVIRPLAGQRAARNIFAAVRAGAQDDPVLAATLDVLREVSAAIGHRVHAVDDHNGVDPTHRRRCVANSRLPGGWADSSCSACPTACGAPRGRRCGTRFINRWAASA